MPLWLTGVIIEDPVFMSGKELGWMCEGVYDSEAQAVAEVPEGGFVVRVRLNEPIPANVEDCEFIWFPGEETREEAVAKLAAAKAAERMAGKPHRARRGPTDYSQR